MAISGNRSDYSEVNDLMMASNALDRVLSGQPGVVADAIEDISTVFEAGTAWTAKFNKDNKEIIQKFNTEALKLDLDDQELSVAHNPALVGAAAQLKGAVEERLKELNAGIKEKKSSCKDDLLSFDDPIYGYAPVTNSAPNSGDLITFN